MDPNRRVGLTHLIEALTHLPCLHIFFEELCDPSETTVPHVLPLLLLLEKSAVILEGSESWESLDSGMDSVLCHLNSARIIACHGETYCSNAKTKLQGKKNLSSCISLKHVIIFDMKSHL